MKDASVWHFQQPDLFLLKQEAARLSEQFLSFREINSQLQWELVPVLPSVKHVSVYLMKLAVLSFQLKFLTI